LLRANLVDRLYDRNSIQPNLGLIIIIFPRI
jgi:hypothetical protein